MKAQAAILHELNTPLRIEEVELPPLQAGQVLVEVAWSGLCHSQLNEIRGRKGEDKFLPHTLGHEGSGKVVAVGAGVTKVKAGDHAVLTWIKGSGQDIPACVYRAEGHTINSGAISTFLTQAVLSENRVVPIPKEVPLDLAALLGCAVPTGAGMVIHTLKPAVGQSLAIFGVGGIGMSAVAAAAMLGCKPIIVIDVKDAKLELAKSLGAHVAINAGNQNVSAAVRAAVGGQGVDYAIEAAGRKEAMETAFQCLAPKGLLVIAGNLPKGQTISIDPYEFIVGKRILGSWGGETNPDQDIPFYIEQYQGGRLPLERFITHRFPLQEINRAVEALEREERVVRVLIACNPQLYG